MSESVAEIKKRVNAENFLDVRHEELIADPGRQLTTICHFLALEPLPEYLKDCSSILYPSPNQSRQKIEWTAADRQIIRDKISCFEFLDGYDFDN